MNHSSPQVARKGGKRNNAAPANDPFYIVASAPPADAQTRVLKSGDSFAVFDHYGDLNPMELGGGLYHQGTRFLSRLVLVLEQGHPLFLSSTVTQDNGILAVDLTNPDVKPGDKVQFPRGEVHLFRGAFLWQGVFYQRLRIRSFASVPVEIRLAYHFEADFCDIFEVRGTKRKRAGEMLEPTVEEDRVELAYRGLDGTLRRTSLVFSPPAQEVSSSRAEFHVSVEPHGEATLYLSAACEVDGERVQPLAYPEAEKRASQQLDNLRYRACSLRTSNERFNDWLQRSTTDLEMMISETEHGPYPYAGVPWFSTPFGRDGIITALEYLWVDPLVARGVLSYLAHTQARELSPKQDAEPGKILHETRKGEMAALGEIPFGRYYGSVDSTPLFLMLAGAYYRRTNDLEFLETIWPNLELALKWIDAYGDVDGDGFVEYFRHSPQGLQHQGWKDSHDSVFHADGALAEGPIALCEVQGYVFAAKKSAAQLAAALRWNEMAAELEQQANSLRERFEVAFWCEDLGTYALALDGRKQPCRVRSSNAGHCLFTGIANREHARRVAEGLLGPDFFTGWGIRTIAEGESRYNPMSYHNGSIWPHDNALVARGLARYGYQHEAMQVLGGLFETSLFVDLHRMPELFCGFPRRPGQGPTSYPVACAPQSWAAAAVFLLLEACLGLEIDAPRKQVRFCYPLLPETLREIRISRLQVGDASVDLVLHRHARDVGVNVVDREGNVEIHVVK